MTSAMERFLIFSTDSDALQIVIYYDVETVNPLGSYRGKHKLGRWYGIFYVGLFYYLLGNIDSSLKSIQLIACVSTENLEKYGFDTILQRFIEETNILSKVCIYMCCSAGDKHIEYCLFACYMPLLS